MAGGTRWQNRLTIQGLKTYSGCISKMRREERQKQEFYRGKDKNSKIRIKRSFAVSKHYNMSCIQIRTSGMEGK